MSEDWKLPAPPVASSSANRRPWLIAGAAVLLVLVAYAVLALAVGDRLPKGAVISGVGVGGLAPEAATTQLTSELGSRAAAAVPLTVAGRTASLVPEAAGLAVDYAASVQAAGGRRSLDPRRLVEVLTGGGPTEAVLRIDDTKLAAALAEVAKTTDRKARDAAIRYDGTKVKRTAAVVGGTLRQPEAAGVVRAAYLRSTDPVDLPVETQPPTITTEAADDVVRTQAKPAVSAAVDVRAGEAGIVRVTPAMIARAVSFAPRDGTLALRLDADRLRQDADGAIRAVVKSKPRDATVRLVKGKPKVIAAVDGTAVSAADLATAVQPALTKKGSARRVEVKLSGAKAKFSTADAKALGVKRVTGQFTTYFPYLEYRNINIGRAAELINGTLLKPGETFSLNGIVGERTRANGFTEGFIIKGGKFKKELGGGVSQSATTTYNAMFFAGLEDVQHQPHTLYIDRYPPGREATVAWPSLDLKFRNNSKYGVLVQAYRVKASYAQRGSLTVRMWSTKSYDKVTSTTPAKSNFSSGQTIKDKSAACEATSAVPGFTADYDRLFYQDDKIVRRQHFRWRYAPTDHRICTKKD